MDARRLGHLVAIAVVPVAILMNGPAPHGDTRGALSTSRRAGSSQSRATTLPARFESYLASDVKPTPEERSRLLSGSPVTKLLDADPSREVYVFGAVWINAPARLYVEAVKDIETFERGAGFRVTKRISAPPRPDDFAALDLPQEDIEDLRTCRVGDCELKLGKQALDALRAEVDWKKPTAKATAEKLARRLAHDYVSGYLEGGNQRLAVYRDQDRPTFVAEEFASMVEQMPSLTTYLPDMRRYLLGFPSVALPNSTSFLYWQETQFGLKPTIRISHLVIQEGSEATVVASKMLYATHYFWTALELRVLLPDPVRGRGFWFITVNRSRSDGLSGFVGRVVRRRVQGEVQKGSLAALTSTKSRLEKAGS